MGLLEYAATAGLSIIVIIFSIGPISCAHVNPAVTVAFAAFGEFPWSKVPIENFIIVSAAIDIDGVVVLAQCQLASTISASSLVNCLPGSILPYSTTGRFFAGNMDWRLDLRY